MQSKLYPTNRNRDLGDTVAKRAGCFVLSISAPIGDGDQIGHTRQNITVMASKKGGIKSLDTVREQGTVNSASYKIIML